MILECRGIFFLIWEAVEMVWLLEGFKTLAFSQIIKEHFRKIISAHNTVVILCVCFEAVFLCCPGYPRSRWLACFRFISEMHTITLYQSNRWKGLVVQNRTCFRPHTLTPNVPHRSYEVYILYSLQICQIRIFEATQWLKLRNTTWFGVWQGGSPCGFGGLMELCICLFEDRCPLQWFFFFNILSFNCVYMGKGCFRRPEEGQVLWILSYM